MKIAIIGGGNIGKLFGALLSGAGSDVTLLVRKKEIVKAIEEKGVVIETSDGLSQTYQVKVTDDISTVQTPDLVIIAVKGYSTQSAMESAMTVVNENTYILSVQNGAGNLEVIREFLRDESRIIGGVFKCVVTPISLNHVLYVTGTGGLNIGPMDGIMNPFITNVSGLFRNTGIEVELSENVQEVIWNKIILNSPLSMATVLGFTNDEFISYPSSEELVRLMAEEAIQVTEAMGFKLPNPEDPIRPLMDTLAGFKASGKKPKCSMLQDMEAGRRTEINTITGSIVREGRKLSIPTPVNHTLMLLVNAMEEKRMNSDKED